MKISQPKLFNFCEKKVYPRNDYKLLLKTTTITTTVEYKT